MRKRSPATIRIVALALALGLLGVAGCGWYVIRPIGEALCFIVPDSTRNPPVPPNAEQIEVGRVISKPDKGHETKLITFQTSDKPTTVYEFYQRSLISEGWVEGNVEAIATYPNRVDSKFNWECGIETQNIVATLQLHTEVITSNRTKVTLNVEYIPR